MINRELYKKVKFDHIDKWYMHVKKNEERKIHWNFDIQKYHLVSARRPGFVKVNWKRALVE